MCQHLVENKCKLCVRKLCFHLSSRCRCGTPEKSLFVATRAVTVRTPENLQREQVMEIYGKLNYLRPSICGSLWTTLRSRAAPKEKLCLLANRITKMAGRDLGKRESDSLRFDVGSAWDIRGD